MLTVGSPQMAKDSKKDGKRKKKASSEQTLQNSHIGQNTGGLVPNQNFQQTTQNLQATTGSQVAVVLAQNYINPMVTMAMPTGQLPPMYGYNPYMVAMPNMGMGMGMMPNMAMMNMGMPIILNMGVMMPIQNANMQMQMPMQMQMQNTGMPAQNTGHQMMAQNTGSQNVPQPSIDENQDSSSEDDDDDDDDEEEEEKNAQDDYFVNMRKRFDTITLKDAKKNNSQEQKPAAAGGIAGSEREKNLSATYGKQRSELQRRSGEVKPLADVPMSKVRFLELDSNGYEYLGAGDWHSFDPKFTPEQCRFGTRCLKRHKNILLFWENVVRPACRQVLGGNFDKLTVDELQKNTFRWSLYGVNFTDLGLDNDFVWPKKLPKNRAALLLRPLELKAFLPRLAPPPEKEKEKQTDKNTEEEKKAEENKNEDKNTPTLRPENIPDGYKHPSSEQLQQQHMNIWMMAMYGQMNAEANKQNQEEKNNKKNQEEKDKKQGGGNSFAGLNSEQSSKTSENKAAAWTSWAKNEAKTKEEQVKAYQPTAVPQDPNATPRPDQMFKSTFKRIVKDENAPLGKNRQVVEVIKENIQ
ncbi:hypothetical protein Slin15195_G064200 [Septoria linicola]|uniref:Uncharacterized protein n=1 Tax=Septoria linicola TaxID=215465 RepID=A0A9Q9EIT2_9PEZI|nr:hypothetical protein Slin15195_G064200 [Septoria linicola]